LWLNIGKKIDRHKCAAARSAARKAIRLAKEDYLYKKWKKGDTVVKYLARRCKRYPVGKKRFSSSKI